MRLFELARARGPVCVVAAEGITSARRFVEHGVAAQLLRDVWYMLQYLLGVPPAVLAGQYERRGAALRGA